MFIGKGRTFTRASLIVFMNFTLLSNIYICVIGCTPIASIKHGIAEQNLYGKSYEDAQHDN